VAGGGWLIRPEEGGAEWVDTAACRAAAPEEVARIAALGRGLILSPRGHAGALPPEEIRWLLAAPRRLACLIDFLAASEDLSRVLSTPLCLVLSAAGDVSWRFASPRRAASEPVAAMRAFVWPMEFAA
jgi:hypothetical protein